MKMKIILLLTQTLLNLVLPAVFVYVSQENLLKGIPCNCCKSLVHRRCSKLKPSEIRDLSKTKNYIWECLYCKKEKFPFVELDCNELEQESFNSLYSCKCLKNTDFTTEKDKNVFHYTPIYNGEDEKSILTDTYNCFESFTIQLF